MSEKPQSVVGVKLDKLLDTEAATGNTLAIYEEWAEKYNSDLKAAGYRGPSRLVEIFSEVCSTKEAAILDWGSGTGLLGMKFSGSGYTNLSGVDISQKSLDVAAASGVYRKLVKLGDSKALFDDDAFDAIVCCGCIVPNHVSPEIFYEWARIVKPGGIIAIAMRRSYIRFSEAEESFFTEELKTKFETVVEDLHGKKRWELVSDTEISDYLADVYGIVFIFKVT